jgi:hypothetical protein
MAVGPEVIDPDNGSGTDRLSLSEWESNLPGTLTGDATAQCRSSSGTKDTTAFVFDVVEASFTARVERHADEPKSATWNAADYTLSAKEPFDVKRPIEIDGIQIEQAGTAQYDWALRIAGYCNPTKVHGVKIKRTAGSGNDQRGIEVSGVSETATISIGNSIIYDVSSSGSVGLLVADSDATVNIHSCTIHNCITGINETGGTANIYNTAVFGCTNDMNSIAGDILFCATDDDDDTGSDGVSLNENASGEWTAAWEDYTADDYRAKSGGALINEGSNGSAWFSDDITGTTRSGTWDIGCHEYVAAGGAVAPTSVLYGPLCGPLAGPI